MSFDSLKVPKELSVVHFLIAGWSYLFVNIWTPKLNSNALKTWSQWTFAIAVNSVIIIIIIILVMI